MSIILGVDTGGTFTDFVLCRNGQLQTHKVLSTPHAPEVAILQGIRELGLDEPGLDELDQAHQDQTADFYIVHGSTVATNAVLEGKGVKTVFITNHGFADMLTIARQTRDELYALQPVPKTPPLTRECCLEAGGRLGARGEVVEDLSSSQLEQLQQKLKILQPQAVAINLLFSYLDDRFEKAIEAVIPEEMFVSRSSFILPEFKEYERGMTTWLNAYVGPLVEGYLQRLQQGAQQAQLSVMQSSGGTIAAEQAGEQAVHMLLSGPAGGLAGARYMGMLANRQRLLTFDMGGTSTDVAMIDGELQLTNEGEIGGYPVAVPMVDMHTIGAGGGSIASLDAGGMLQVGPESAGATPGPACYGQGGTKPTVTDANLILGRLRAEAFLGGGMKLDEEAARQALASLAEPMHMSVEEIAAGIIRIADEHMAHALRVMSVQRGIDPRDLTLVSFGGAGGLHVCSLAESMGMNKALVPIHAGVLSALGMLVAPRERQLSRSRIGPLARLTATELEMELSPLIQQGQKALLDEGVKNADVEIQRSLDLRYQGQSYYLNIALQDDSVGGIAVAEADFHYQHQQRYGHQLDLPVELVNIRVALKSSAGTLPVNSDEAHTTKQPAEPVEWVELVGIDGMAPVYERDKLVTGQKLAGPVLITETVSTTYIAPGWSCTREETGNLILRR
ncbi:MAG: hydantoinase/oxoprolinase family protein [Gammaproteobacteria bacterium]|nr:hydantoinase/oxoprolinase family protein [Gammaproteobacteria bacterium]